MPVASRTPAAPGPATQSPAMLPAAPDVISPLMLNPPAGIVTGATPAGGGMAWIVKATNIAPTTHAGPGTGFVFATALKLPLLCEKIRIFI